MDWAPYLPLISTLLALLIGLAVGKAWERYKLRDGRWIDRRKARDSQHYVLGLNFLVSNQIDLAIEELSRAARVDADALEIHMMPSTMIVAGRLMTPTGGADCIHAGNSMPTPPRSRCM